MKIQSALLQVMALALLSASCEQGTGETAQAHKNSIKKIDTVKREKTAVDSLKKGSSSPGPISRDYCPPCGRG